MMNIRKYTKEDKGQILGLLSVNTPAYFAEEEKNDLIYYLDNFADNYFVYENEMKILGCGGFNLTEDSKTAKISWDIIDNLNQGKGIGRKLMLYRLERIRQINSIEKVSVRTSQLVYPFYEKFGLVLHEIIPDYWARGFDMYRLECDIKYLKLL